LQMNISRNMNNQPIIFHITYGGENIKFKSLSFSKFSSSRQVCAFKTAASLICNLYLIFKNFEMLKKIKLKIYAD